MRRLLIKIGIIKMLLTVVSAFYFIGFEVIPPNVDGFYVNVFNPLPGGAADSKASNRRAYDDLQNMEAMVARLNVDVFNIMYNTTSATAQKEYDKFNELTYSMDKSVAEKLRKGDKKLVRFLVESYEANKEYTMRDGNVIYGIDEIARVTFVENGVKKEEKVRLKLGYVPLLRVFKVVDMDVNI